MQDERQAFGQDLSVTPAKCQVMIKYVGNTGLYPFGTIALEYGGLINVSFSI